MEGSGRRGSSLDLVLALGGPSLVISQVGFADFVVVVGDGGNSFRLSQRGWRYNDWAARKDGGRSYDTACLADIAAQIGPSFKGCATNERRKESSPD